MHFPFQFVTLLAGLASSSTPLGGKTVRQATNGPRQGTIIWICNSNADPAQDIPEVCKNMCYGAYCRGYGASLTWDNYAGRTKQARAADAGCGLLNHCSINPPGNESYQCNEYPFASTSDADRTDKLAVSRCVPCGQHNRQGARLNQLYNNEGPWKNSQGLNGTPPAVFRQSFANAGLIKYCSGARGNACLNDGLQYDRNGEIVDPISKRYDDQTGDGIIAGEQISYRLRSGEIIEVAEEFEVGHNVYIPRERNSSLLTEQAEAHVYDYSAGLEQFDWMMDNLYVDEDVVEERLS